jgi:type II secretory pathway pseudopilin PulG
MATLTPTMLTRTNLRVTKVSSRGFGRWRERGYALLAMLLAVSLLVIAAAAVAPTIALQIRRERETELLHRAGEYRRAVRRFAKQTGRYPMKIEDLESTNGIRYLRKRFKDPVTGRDFKLLHMADIPTALGTSTNNWSLQPGANASGNGDGISPAGENATAPAVQNAQSIANGGVFAQGAATAGFGLAGSSSTNPAPSANQQGGQSGNQGFGGGVIIGVASTSKKKTIREFNSRNHYNQWLFFYDPGYERPFEVQGPTPLTHPPTSLQSAAGSSSTPATPASTAPPSPVASPSPAYNYSPE